MATGRENADWHVTGLIRRDFRQDHGGGPEEMKGHTKRKGKKWCKGKEGREHRFEQVLWNSFTWMDSIGRERTRNIYRWICKGCGKVEWSQPRVVPKHDHHYCLTEIVERWKHEEIFEKCCICGAQGKKYSFYRS